MATQKRRAQPKKRSSAKHRSAAVAVRRAGGSPAARPAVFQREPPVIADTATCFPAGAVFIDAAEERVLFEIPAQPHDVPRESIEDEAELESFGLTQLPLHTRLWFAAGGTLLLGLGIAATVWFGA